MSDGATNLRQSISQITRVMRSRLRNSQGLSDRTLHRQISELVRARRAAR